MSIQQALAVVKKAKRLAKEKRRPVYIVQRFGENDYDVIASELGVNTLSMKIEEVVYPDPEEADPEHQLAARYVKEITALQKERDDLQRKVRLVEKMLDALTVPGATFGDRMMNLFARVCRENLEF